MIQPLPDDEFLVVAGRCQWRPPPDGPEQNATVFGPTGAARRTGCLGDGIAEVFTTRSGAIWAGYFDEGVFGNFGWGGARGSSRPIGERGIVRFDPASLGVAWQLPPSSIADCYAINVYGEEVWSCYYTDFPIARVADGRVTEWPNDVIGRGPDLHVFADTRWLRLSLDDL